MWFVAVLVTLFVVFVWLNLSSSEEKVGQELDHLYGVEDPQFRRSLGLLLGPALLEGNRVEALVNGDRIFPSMLEAIRSARRTITFETFIYWSGETGREFAEALAERAKAGVRVHVLVDWVGSDRMDDELLSLMQDAGVEMEKYRPLHFYNLNRMNNRTHRKLLVIDGRVGFTGGVGIADQWLGDAQDSEHWRDTHFRVEGPVVAQMQSAFMENWSKTRAIVLHSEDYFPAIEPAGDQVAQMFKSSAREGSESARLMYLLSIAAAERSILISNAYFVPDDLSVESLVNAKERGVSIQILVPGRHIDSSVVRAASRSRWGPLLEAGIEIFEFQPTMMHCKIMVVDEVWTTVGSTNFDNRSFRLNDEANLNVYDPGFARLLASQFRGDLARSRRITLEEWRRRPLRERAAESLSSLVRLQL